MSVVFCTSSRRPTRIIGLQPKRRDAELCKRDLASHYRKCSVQASAAVQDLAVAAAGRLGRNRSGNEASQLCVYHNPIKGTGPRTSRTMFQAADGSEVPSLSPRLGVAGRQGSVATARHRRAARCNKLFSGTSPNRIIFICTYIMQTWTCMYAHLFVCVCIYIYICMCVCLLYTRVRFHIHVIFICALVSVSNIFVSTCISYLSLSLSPSLSLSLSLFPFLPICIKFYPSI